MAEIAVSFVSEPNAESRIRRVSFPCVAKRQLHYDIRMSMDNIAFFACYLAPGGGVIALERRGNDQHLTVLSLDSRMLPPAFYKGWDFFFRTWNDACSDKQKAAIILIITAAFLW